MRVCLNGQPRGQVLYDTIRAAIRDAILTYSQKLTRVSLIYLKELTTKRWNTEKLKSKKTGMLRSIGKQSGESAQSVLKKKRKGCGRKDLQRGRFKPGMKT